MLQKKVLSYWEDLFDKKLRKELKELDNRIENQGKFNQLIADLIDQLDFDDSNAKEKEQEKDTSSEDQSTPEGQEEDSSLSVKDEDNGAEADLNALDANFESLNENQDSNTKEEKEVTGDPSLQKKNQKNLSKEK